MKWSELRRMLDIEVRDDAEVTFCLDPDGEPRMFKPTRIHANVGDEVEVVIEPVEF